MGDIVTIKSKGSEVQAKRVWRSKNIELLELLATHCIIDAKGKGYYFDNAKDAIAFYEKLIKGA